MAKRCGLNRADETPLAEELEGYLATEDWQGKAGAYGIQGPAGAFIPWISGSYPAIMGLPLPQTVHLLQAAGLNIWGQL